jgi:hypothetical protein
MMPSIRQLLTIATVVEGLTGVALVRDPGTTVAQLLGAHPDRTGQMLGRVTGVALFSLGAACWGARGDAGGVARSGTLWAITLYNAGAGLLLLRFAATGQARGVAAWGAGLLHVGLAAGFIAAPAEGEASRSWWARGLGWRR